jgi:hypothetical protein
MPGRTTSIVFNAKPQSVAKSAKNQNEFLPVLFAAFAFLCVFAFRIKTGKT